MNDSHGIELRTVTSFDEFMAMRDDWNGLLEQSGHDRVFLRHEWFTAWWQAFGKGRKLFIVVASGRDGMCGIVPLMRCQSSFRGIPVRGIEFISNNDSPGCGFILRRNHEYLAGSIMSYILKDSRDWDVILLKNMIHDETVGASLRGVLDETGTRFFVSPGLSSPYIEIRDDWDAYFKALSSKSRKTIRNVCNRIRRLGDVILREYNSMEGFDDMASVSLKAWKYREGKAFINRSDRKNFFELLSREAQNRGWLSIWYVYKDGEPIAYEYHLRYKGMDTALLSEFNSEYGSFSPGTYLDYEIIKSLFVSGVREYDMCGVLDEYKRKWTSRVRDYKNLTIFSDSKYSRFLYFIEEKPVRLIKKVRDRMVSSGD
ncbi:MAG: GNAT family N-acetyltransferase [Nitrospirae bacterium]|nr:GNAT family N-acetyltransferase [Nitrospirota bacterium]